jgi:hypothetical protein
MILENGANFIWRNARLLERAIFEYYFYEASPIRIIDILRAYQNEDGGFGHALEPDLRAPDSHPLFVEFALRTLYDCQLRDPTIAHRVCDFLAKHADLQHGIPPIFPSSQNYPRARHWTNRNMEPSWDRLVGLVGLANWQGVHHIWLKNVVDVCLDHMASTTYTDAHTIMNAFCLLESVAQERDVEQLFHKLAQDLVNANYFSIDVPVKTYALTPLTLAPTPDAYCRQIFSRVQIDAHLNELISLQMADGGWPIQWKPPGEAAQWEWRAQKTVNALVTLHAYGKL